jgi:penicillin amidase
MKHGKIGKIHCQVLFLLVIIGSLVLLGSCTSLILKKGWPEYEGEFGNLPLQQPVTVLRDKHGIPHIYAQNKHDLLVAQGFVHAQDRLWQMETLRRVASGRLSEFAGEGRVELDTFCRMLGFPDLRRNAARALSSEDRAMAQAYADGVNAYIQQLGEDLPLEFQSSDFAPEEYTVEDTLSLFIINSWLFRENYRAELIALAGRQVIETEDWKDIFPSYPNATLPDDSYFESLRSLKIGSILPEALSFFQALPEHAGGGGTNMWISKDGPGGKPLLANDTHIGSTLPNTWYLCHLNAPGINVAGVSAPGTPGIMGGHTDSVAWGIAIFPIDFVDLYIVRVDPQNPTRYTVGDRNLEMEQEQIVIGLPEGESVSKTVYYTIYGPVITELSPGTEGAVALHWYGTLPDGELTDGTLASLLRLMEARSVTDVMDALEDAKIMALSFIAGDTAGNIGWQTIGAVPRRSGYSGRLPADGSSGTHGWHGFIDFDEMPASYNPPEGQIINTNNRTIPDSDPYVHSFSWSGAYRRERVAALLEELDSPTVEDFRRMQMDVYSLQADNILPKLFAYSFEDDKAAAALEMLKSWDRQVRADSQGAAVYEVFLNQWVRTLLEDELGEDLFPYFHITFKKYLIHNVILDRLESSVWDRRDTTAKETPQQILEMALSRTYSWLEEELGGNPNKWEWGELHFFYWKHAGGNSWFTAMLLNVGPFPADGDCTTLNSNAYIAAKDEYKVTMIPAVRMVIPLDDINGMKINVPLGQSGQPGHDHYDDLIEGWIEGEFVDFPVHREDVEAMTVSELILKP